MQIKARNLGAMMLLFPFAAGSVVLCSGARRRTASADSAAVYAEGTRSTGALVAEGCPIAVERETLTLDVRQLPPLDGGADFAEYGASVTTQYTLRNPTEEDCTQTLFFPFGTAPDYLPEGFDFNGDTARYSIKENGNDVAVESRYTYCRKGNFDADDGIALISGADAEGFFREDTPVTTHTFHVTVPEGEGDGQTDYMTLCFALKADPAKTRIAASAPSFHCIEKGLAVLAYGFAQTRGDFDFSVYVFGEDAAFKKQGVFESRPGGEEYAGTAVEETARTEETFSSFVAERYPGEESGIGREDWARGFAEALGTVSEGVICSAVPDDICAADFMRWYEYELNFPAGEEVVHEITAPIYPAVRGNGGNVRYEYTYLLSPARKWASFGSLRVEIKTAEALSACSLDFTLDPEGQGYVAEWEDGLPLGELTFTLTSMPSAPNGVYVPYERGLSTVEIALIVLLCVVVAAVIACAVALIVRRKRAKAPQRNGQAREGKVDLPPDEKERK